MNKKNLFCGLIILIISGCSSVGKISEKKYLVSRDADQKIVIGKISTQDLWNEMPEWKELFDDYEPNAGVVNQLRAEEKDFSIVCIFGNWCPDSRNGVPSFLKALDEAGNAHLDLELFAVDRSMRDPEQMAQKLGVTHVPTYIIYYQGLEVFRMVEIPRSTFEEDLAKFLVAFGTN